MARALNLGDLKKQGVIAVELRLGGSVWITWPTWDGIDAWDVWDQRGHTLGATKVATRVMLSGALACAQKVKACDLETPEGREARNKIMRDDDDE